MRSVLSAILVFEAIIIGLAIPVAITLGEVPSALAGAVGGAAAVTCLVVTGLLRFPVGKVLGSVLQVVVFGLGFVVPLMFVLGVIFGVMWFGFLVLDRRIAASKAAHDQSAPPAD
ncbi:DUF4233 domain-containing protein [Actinopolymorpha alba]|uniref:DUF4233 domain-containing protein n=1 Tax=Actinopolymorpha alba TaxID=533267 RepID=UPI00035C5AE2|nr:DUF4233 domain-containing protein [Actinopolymorpha alba]